MQEELGEGYAAFLESYNQTPKKGVRTNRLKANPAEVLAALPEDFHAQPVPWCENGFYIDAQARPGKQPAYYTGLYYPQEPSAMTPAEALDAQPGETVLDLCAAPGGKTTQIASAMGGEGLLVANEIVKSRAAVLGSNLERMGVKNALLLNVFPEHLNHGFYERFDRILVDAPCSGEGMFRKDPAVRTEWSPERVTACAARQEKILETIDKLLKPGGTLVYSTCTFAPEENEQVVEQLVQTGRYEVVPISMQGIPTTGLAENTRTGMQDVTGTMRIWPQYSSGEGHYTAKLIKTASAEDAAPKRAKRDNAFRKASKKDLKDYKTFEAAYLSPDFTNTLGELVLREDNLYALPKGLYYNMLDGLKVYRPGLHLGVLKKNRFEPSHALAMALKPEEFSNVFELENEDAVWQYLKGESSTVQHAPDAGWTLLTWQNHPIGFGKTTGKTIKNRYPKGLRIYKK